MWNSQGTQTVIGFQDFGENGFGGAVQLPGESTLRAALIGTKAFLTESGMTIPEILLTAAREWEEEGAPVFYCGWDAAARAVLRFGG